MRNLQSNVLRYFTYLAGHVLLLFIITFVGTVHAQNATNYAAVDSVKVGDTFNYSIVVRADQSYEQLIFPDTADFGSPISILEQKRYRINQQTDSLSYTLQFFGTENYTIPKLPVRLIQETDTTALYVPPVPLDFKSALQAENESLLPLKPIFDFALVWWPWLAGFIILVILGYGLYRWYQKRKEKTKKEERPVFKPQPFRDPIKELEDNLQQIRANKANLQNNGQFKDFYISLGDALRWYLERVYRIPALESTSRELIRDLHQNKAPEAIIHKTETVLKEADMVKFARFTPTLQQADKAMQEAEEFLQIAQSRDQQRVEHLRSRHDEEQQRKKEEMYSKNQEIEVETHV